MIYVVWFEDNEAHADMRAKHMADHLAFLEQNAANVQAAGPLKEVVGGDGAGGLWLVEADSPDAVQRLIESDPFWPTGLRKSHRILAWTRVFESGVRQH